MLHLVSGGQLYRFRGEQSKWHDGELIWPGYKGFPVLADYYFPGEHVGLSLTHFFHSKLFDLSNPEDNMHYNWVSERIVNGWFLPIVKEIKNDGQGIKIYLEWAQRYLITLKPEHMANLQVIEESFPLNLKP